MAKEPEQCFRESGFHRSADSAKNSARTSFLPLETRYSRSAGPGLAKYDSSKLRGQPSFGHAGPAPERERAGDKPAIGWAEPERSEAA